LEDRRVFQTEILIEENGGNTLEAFGQLTTVLE